MTRTLSKVLAICAMAVSFALLCVGTGMAAFFSVDNIVNVAAIVDEYAEGIERPTIKYGSTEKENFEIKEGHTKTVEVKAVYPSEAYKFLGWYAGTADQYYANKNNVTLNSSELYNINMAEEGTYVAVFEVNRFTVAGWEYLSDPADETSTATEPAGAQESYIYGKVLPTVSTENPQYAYAGWKISGDRSGARYKNANFASQAVKNGRVSLIDPWRELGKISVEMKYADKQSYYVEIYQNEEKSISELSADAIADWQVNLNEIGYTYTWYNGDNAITTINSETDISVTLVRTATKYTSSLVYETADLKNAAGDATFSVEDVTGLQNWLNMETKYSFWYITGLEFGGQTYTASNLSDLAVAYATAYDANGTAGAITLVVEKSFENISFDYSTMNCLASETKSDTSDDYVFEVYKSSSETSKMAASSFVKNGGADRVLQGTETIADIFDIDAIYYAMEKNELNENYGKGFDVKFAGFILAQDSKITLTSAAGTENVNCTPMFIWLNATNFNQLTLNNLVELLLKENVSGQSNLKGFTNIQISGLQFLFAGV